MRKSVVVLLVIIVVAGIWYFMGGKAANTGVTLGKTAPEFELNDLNGLKVKLMNPGKIMVINFWATWCPPCRGELPELQSFFKANSGNINFYAINIGENPQKVQDFLTENKYSIPVLLDSNGNVADLYKITAIPTTIIIDKTGIIKFRKTGGVTQQELEEKISSL